VQCQPGDVTGDGRADFACLYHERDGRQFLATAISNGDGSFNLDRPPILILDDPGSTSVSGGFTFETRAMAVGDTNADGLEDVLILDLRPDDVQRCDLEHPEACDIRYELFTQVSNGDGTYRGMHAPTDWRRTPTGPLPVLAAADLNGDGRSDYLVLPGALGSQSNPEVRAAIRRLDGGYMLKTQPAPQQLADWRTNSVTLGDANGDGRTDILVAAPLNPQSGVNCSRALDFRHPILTTALSLGDGTFVFPPRWDDCRVSREVDLRWETHKLLAELRAGDTNGDGLADFLLGFATPDEFYDDKNWYGFYDSVSKATGWDTHRWVAADLSGDGRDDLVYVSSQKNSPNRHDNAHLVHVLCTSCCDAPTEATPPRM
jgi:FG-GAP-like repeat/FG-GAP repeat